MNPTGVILGGLVILAMAALIKVIARSGHDPETHRIDGQLIILRCPDHPEVTELVIRLDKDLVCSLCGRELEVLSD